MKKYVLSLSYGKDSLACLGAIRELGWLLGRIIHAEVWATDTIPADLPPMVEFKAKADAIIKERWGVEVEHIRSGKTYESVFHRIRTKSRKGRNGEIYGWPARTSNWCNSELKTSALKKAQKGAKCIYIGIAADEPNRFHNLSKTKRSPLVEAGWTEKICRGWCVKMGLLSPIYTDTTRGGCWFCHNQSVNQLRLLRKNYPEYWKLMLKWDRETPPFAYFVHKIKLQDFEQRFQMEDDGLIRADDRAFRWSMLEEELNYRLF